MQNIHPDGTLGPAPIAVNFCPKANATITSDVSGTNYQWQLNTGSGFTNISDNDNYSGTSATALHLTNIPSNWYGYVYQYSVNGGAISSLFKLKAIESRTGAADNNWNNTTNWICGYIRDAYCDVSINSGTMIVNVNTTVRSLSAAPGSNVTVMPVVVFTVIH